MRRKILVILAAFGLAGLGCKDPKPDPASAPSVAPATSSIATDEPAGEILARIHFVGSDQLEADTNAATLNRIGSLPETAALRSDILDKLATAPGRSMGLATNVTAEVAAGIRPLLNDLLSAESYLEVRDKEGGEPEWALAVNLKGTRLGAWESGLKDVLAGLGHGQTSPFEANGTKGWEVAAKKGGNVFRFFKAEGGLLILDASGQPITGWTVLGSGAGEQSLAGEIVARLAAGGKPGPSGEEDALEVTIDFPRLVEEFKWDRWEGLPYIDIQSRVVKDNVRSTGSLVFPEALGLTTDAWKIPTNTIHDPLISFTAARGIAPWLEKQSFYQAVKLKQTPNQAFAWAMGGPFFLSHIAVPAPGSTNQIGELVPRLEKIFREEFKKRGLGTVTNVAKATMVQWMDGFPIAARPFVRSSEEATDDFLMMGLLPVGHGQFTNPPPAALVGQITGKKDLIYYNWEITQDRLTQLKLIFQFASWISNRPKMAANTAADKWVNAVGANLGNTATEITLASPREMKLVRTSHLGLSAFEIMTLSYWVNSGEFPLDGLRMPFLPLRESGSLRLPVGPAVPPNR